MNLLARSTLIVLCMTMSGISWAGVDEGMAAFKRRDYAEAFKEFRQPAKQGNAVAQFKLGYMYDAGLGVEQNKAEAFSWFKKSAAQGDADAQGYLGMMYANGSGVKQDKVEAVKWYRLAANLGNGDAQLSLARAYYNGEGVEQSNDEAERWASKAAGQAEPGTGLLEGSKDLLERIKQTKK